MKKKKPADPFLKQLLLELEDVVRKTGYNVRYEKGDFEGGYCIVKESRLIVVNTRFDIDKRILVVARTLKQLGIEGIYIKPIIRELIESESIPSKKDREEMIQAEQNNENFTETDTNTEEKSE